MTIYYSVVEYGGVRRHRLENCPYDFDALDYIVEECAEDYFGNYDGHTSAWPLTFALYATEDGPELARMLVDCQYSPLFTATKVETEEPNV